MCDFDQKNPVSLWFAFSQWITILSVLSCIFSCLYPFFWLGYSQSICPLVVGLQSSYVSENNYGRKLNDRCYWGWRKEGTVADSLRECKLVHHYGEECGNSSTAKIELCMIQQSYFQETLSQNRNEKQARGVAQYTLFSMPTKRRKRKKMEKKQEEKTPALCEISQTQKGN